MDNNLYKNLDYDLEPKITLFKNVFRPLIHTYFKIHHSIQDIGLSKANRVIINRNGDIVKDIIIKFKINQNVDMRSFILNFSSICICIGSSYIIKFNGPELLTVLECDIELYNKISNIFYSKKELLIPLSNFISKELFYPLIALQYLNYEIEFVHTNESHVKIYSTYVQLSYDERKKFAQFGHEYYMFDYGFIYNKIKKGKTELKINLDGSPLYSACIRAYTDNFTSTVPIKAQLYTNSDWMTQYDFIYGNDSYFDMIDVFVAGSDGYPSNYKYMKPCGDAYYLPIINKDSFSLGGKIKLSSGGSYIKITIDEHDVDVNIMIMLKRLNILKIMSGLCGITYSKLDIHPELNNNDIDDNIDNNDQIKEINEEYIIEI